MREWEKVVENKREGKRKKKNDSEVDQKREDVRGDTNTGREGQRQIERDVIKCLRARRVYPFHLSPDSHSVPANEKPTHANCQLGSLSVIWKCCLNLICIISHISWQPALDNTHSQSGGWVFVVTFDLNGQRLLSHPNFPVWNILIFLCLCALFAFVPAWVNMHMCVSKCIHPSD